MCKKSLSMLLLLALLSPVAVKAQVLTMAPAKAPVRAGCVAPSNVQVTPGPDVAIVNWESDQSTFNLRYAEAAALVFNGFEDGTLGNWTAVDNDGDGYNWNVNGTFGSHSGTYMVNSASYNSTDGALTPDNFLISPHIILGGELCFWACAQDAEWSEEHFGVAVSTTDAEPSSFTTIQQWDMNAKGQGNPTGTTRGGNRDQGTWYQYKVDLSDYEGQQGYVAIRHFDCSDWFYLNVDDITITPSNMKWNTVDGITGTSYTITDLNPETDYLVQVTPTCGEYWSDLTPFTTLAACTAPTGLAATNITPTSATLTWSGWSDLYEVQYAAVPTKLRDGQWLQYDNGTLATYIGNQTSNTWTWAVMYPASMLSVNNQLTKISIYETSYNTQDITITILSGTGDTPETTLYTETVTPLGGNVWHEITLSEPVSLNTDENLWIALTETGTYVISACSSNEPNNQWVYFNGWYNIGDLASSLSSYGWMIRAFVEPDFDITTLEWTTVPKVTSPYELTDLTPDTQYVARVRSLCDDTETYLTVMFKTPEACGVPANLNADEVTPTTATLSWLGYQENYNVQFRRLGQEVTSFFDDFENGLDGWTVIDDDGDGYGWMSNITEGYNLSAYSGSGVAFSQSYTDDDGALDPNNWLISPQVSLGGTVKFWARGQDEEYCEENFAIFVSTTDTDPSNFEQVSDDFTATGEYVQYSADLSAYEGQRGYVAIRHYESSDWFILNIDDFGIYTGEVIEGTDWEFLEAVEDNPFLLEGLLPEATYEVMVQGNCSKTETTPWTEVYTFTTLSSCERPNSLNVTDVTDNSATLSWKGYQESFNVRYRTLEMSYAADFSDGIPSDWITFDEDGDGYTWDGGEGYVYSASYLNGVGALTPDNWLVTSEVPMGGFVQFFAFSLDSDWADERFAIYYSPDGTDPDDFTQISNVFVSTGDGAFYTIDLSAYSGTGRLAIRHFNCTDMYWLVVTSFEVYTTNAWTTVTNVTSPCALVDLDEDSIYEVEAQGVCDGSETTEWSDSYFFMTLQACPTPLEVTVDEITATSATLSWSGEQNSFNVRYRMPAQEVTSFFDDFEGDVSGWTLIDSDGDGYNWGQHINTGSGNLTTHSDVGCMYSASYDNDEEEPLTPDNWLITPQVQLGGTVKFWARGQDASYASEVFAIYVSTTDTDIESFGKVAGDFTATGSYKAYTADLSAYEGQTGYVAIRHYNVTDMFYLNIDDFGIYTGEIIDASEWVTATDVSSPYSITDLTADTDYEVQVQGICDDGLSNWSDITVFTTALSCQAPTNVKATQITYNSAVVSWTDNNGSTSWQLEVYSYSDYQTTDWGTVTPITVTENPYTITDLSPNENYIVYVYANCDEGEVSLPSSFMYFTTEASPCQAPTEVTVSNVTYNTAEVSWTSGSDDITQWDIAYGTADEVTYYSGGYYYLDESVLVPISVTTTNYVLEGLLPETLYYVFVRSACDAYPPSAWIDAYTSFITAEAPTDVEQTLTLSAGWGWFSSYIEYPADALSTIEAGIASVSTTGLIKSQTQAVTLNEGVWEGTLETMENEQMYLILSEGGEVSLSGPLADPEEHPIELGNGWSWIGFLSPEAMGLNAALSSIDPAEGDLIKSQTASATYYEGQWTGDQLQSLEPGMGYIYLHNGDGLTLVYPSVGKGVVNTTPVELHWDGNHNFATNLTMMVTLDESEVGMRAKSHEVGAFVNGECRGSARLEPANGGYVAILTVSGEAGEEVSFRLYDVTTGEEYPEAAKERVSYSADAVYGSIPSPMRLHFGTTGVGETSGAVSVYPNPTSDKVRVMGTGISAVRVYNAMGQLLCGEEGLDTGSVEVNLGHYSAGVYTVSVTLTDGQTTNKLVVKE